MIFKMLFRGGGLGGGEAFLGGIFLLSASRKWAFRPGLRHGGQSLLDFCGEDRGTSLRV